MHIKKSNSGTLTAISLHNNKYIPLPILTYSNNKNLETKSDIWVFPQLYCNSYNNSKD